MLLRIASIPSERCRRLWLPSPLAILAHTWATLPSREATKAPTIGQLAAPEDPIRLGGLAPSLQLPQQLSTS